ncbi:MAG: hypothetical protein JSW66_08315 [Phycisphaerales bacterium]|nr:MAG: hypothetical protein JSW66_08315 [Phycisphaerales bacterium]
MKYVKFKPDQRHVGMLAAIDFQGNIAWRKQIVPWFCDVTLGGSPILYDDTVNDRNQTHNHLGDGFRCKQYS